MMYGYEIDWATVLSFLEHPDIWIAWAWKGLWLGVSTWVADNPNTFSYLANTALGAKLIAYVSDRAPDNKITTLLKSFKKEEKPNEKI